MRRLPLVAGILALGAGTALALDGGSTLPTVDGTLPFVVAVLVGGAVAVSGLLARTADGPSSEPLPEPGAAATARVPGGTVDRRLAALSGRDAEERAELEARIERAAVATLARTAECSPEVARDRLAEGTWTDDGRAAALFTDEERSPSLREHLRALATGETPVQRDAARAVAELSRRAGDE